MKNYTLEEFIEVMETIAVATMKNPRWRKAWDEAWAETEQKGE